MKGDKRKLIVVVALVVVVVGVGAFSFLAPSEPVKVTVRTKTVKSEKEAAEKGDPQRDAILAMVTGPLPVRDPFRRMNAPVAEAPAEVVGNTDTPTPPAASAPARPAPRASGPSTPVRPLDPLPGGDSLGMGGPGLSISKGAPARNPDEFAYSVQGVVLGEKPMVVLQDDEGNQTLVPLGGTIGGGQITSIERERVCIRHRGKEKSVPVSEGP